MDTTTYPNITHSMSKECSNLFASMAKVQGEMDSPDFDCHVDYSAKNGRGIKFSYTSLQKVQETLRPNLYRHGLSVMQHSRIVFGQLSMVTLVTHESGEWIEFIMPMIGGMGEDTKEYGGLQTYHKRYSLYSIFNMAGQEDKDAHQFDEGENNLKKNFSPIPSKKVSSLDEPPPTPNQIKLLEDLMKGEEARKANLFAVKSQELKREISSFNDFTKSEASDVIDKVLTHSKEKKEYKNATKY